MAVRDHIALALSRLPSQYRGGDIETNTQKVLRALLAPAADLEQAMQDVLNNRSIDTAVGAQLTALGKRVGRDRNGEADDEIYRRYVRAQITANKSDGLISDLITIVKLVLGTVDDVTIKFHNEGPAAFTIELDGADVFMDDTIAAVMIELLLRAAGAGVRPILQYTTDPTTVGRWGSGLWGTSEWARAIDREI